MLRRIFNALFSKSVEEPSAQFPTKEPVHVDVHYEPRDVRVSGILVTAGALSATLLAVAFIVWGLFAVFTALTNRPPLPGPFGPMQISKKGPGLEVTVSRELQEIRAQEDKNLTEYARPDPTQKTVRIPIERAMNLMVEQGPPDWNNKTEQIRNQAQSTMDGKDDKSAR